MSGFPKRGGAAARVLVLLAAGAIAGVAGAVPATDNKSMVVVPYQHARFEPVDPARPDGPAIAVLWGDPATGPSAMLLKLKKGPGQLHTHTSDYHLVMVEGTMKHWEQGEREADAPSLEPGSYWFQPGNQGHTGACLTDECVMFVKWEGKRDGRAVTEGEAPSR